MNDKPYSQACENNKQAILEVLGRVFSDAENMLEIGSGTGQHAVSIGAQLAPMVWQTSDRKQNHSGIMQWLDSTNARNLRMPIELDVLESAWPSEKFSAVFSANTAHIMSWAGVEAMFAGVGQVLAAQGRFALYGPFNYGGEYTGDGNRRFDAHLTERDPLSGIRDFEALDGLAKAQNMRLVEDNQMPADNHLLIWQRD